MLCLIVSQISKEKLRKKTFCYFFSLIQIIFLDLRNKTRQSMTIYTGSQAQAIIRQDKYPINSIGVTRCTQGYAYWFWDGWTFDSGVESTEEKALRTAKKNWR